MSIHLVIQPCSIHPFIHPTNPSSQPVIQSCSIHPSNHPSSNPTISIQPASHPTMSIQPVIQPGPSSKSPNHVHLSSHPTMFHPSIQSTNHIQPASQSTNHIQPASQSSNHVHLSIEPVIQPYPSIHSYPSIHPVSDDQPYSSAQSTNKTANCASPTTVFITLAGGQELSSGVSVCFLFVLSCRTSWQPSVTNYKRMRRDLLARPGPSGNGISQRTFLVSRDIGLTVCFFLDVF